MGLNMSNVIRATVQDFIEGKLDHYWNQPSLNLYKEWFNYSVHIDETNSTDNIIVCDNTFIDPNGFILTYFGENLNIQHLLTEPKVEYIISDYNALFTLNLSDWITDDLKSKMMITDFPAIYIDPNKELLDTYNKKKRWNFRKSLENENSQITLEFVYKPSKNAIDLVKERWLQLNNDTISEIFCLPDAMSLGDWCYQWIHIHKGTSLVGLALLVFVEPKVFYVVIFNSIEPCLYSFVQKLYNIYDPGTYIHFGASYSFTPHIFDRFRYKNSVANTFIQSPYIASVNDADDLCPPYFSLTQNKWVCNE